MSVYQISILYILHNAVITYTRTKLEGEKERTTSVLIISIFNATVYAKVITYLFKLNSFLSSLTIHCYIYLPLDLLKVLHSLCKWFGPEHHFCPALNTFLWVLFCTFFLHLFPAGAEGPLQLSLDWTSIQPHLKYSMDSWSLHSFILEQP